MSERDDDENETVAISTVAHTTVANDAILDAPQGPEQAALEVMGALAETTGNAKIRHAARYLAGMIDRDLEPLEGWSECVDLKNGGATNEDVASLMGKRFGLDKQHKQNVRRQYLRRLNGAYPGG